MRSVRSYFNYFPITFTIVELQSNVGIGGGGGAELDLTKLCGTLGAANTKVAKLRRIVHFMFAGDHSSTSTFKYGDILLHRTMTSSHNRRMIAMSPHTLCLLEFNKLAFVTTGVVPV